MLIVSEPGLDDVVGIYFDLGGVVREDDFDASAVAAAFAALPSSAVHLELRSQSGHDLKSNIQVSVLAGRALCCVLLDRKIITPRQPEIRIRFGCGGQKKSKDFVARKSLTTWPAVSQASPSPQPLRKLRLAAMAFAQ
jgi:hypothetical protein